MSLDLDIGFIGLGNMGFPMFSNLVRKLPRTTTVHFFDVLPSSMERAGQQSESGAKFDPCGSPKEVAEKSNIVVSMVPEDKHVRNVYLDSDTGIIAASILERKILVDCSTIDPETSLSVGKEIHSRHPESFFYDAPVSGGTGGATDGTITFMLGLSQDDQNLPTLKNLLSLMGQNIFTCGGPSLGLTAKLANNYLSLSISLLNAEMFNFAIKSDMDPRVLQDILRASTGCNRNQERENPVPGLSPKSPSSNGYQKGFKIEYVKKDIGLALDACKRVGARLCLGERIYSSYVDAASDPRCSGLDAKVIYRWIGGDEDWQKKF